MANEDCVSWTYELADDSLKQMWRADQAYRDGDREQAIALLASQVKDRIPLIESKAKSECQTQKLCYDARPLQQDLRALAGEMIKGRAYKHVNDRVFQIDKKYSLPSYYSFCACKSR